MWQRFKTSFEKLIPMTFGSLVLFAIVIYLVFIVGKTVWENFQSNKQIIAEQTKLFAAEDDLRYMENEIAYYKTSSFKDKQARAKLGYIAPGEKALSLPTDEPAPGDSKAPAEKVDETSISNYYLWLDYFLN